MKQRICRYFFNGNHIVNACISLVYWGKFKKKQLKKIGILCGIL